MMNCRGPFRETTLGNSSFNTQHSSFILKVLVLRFSSIGDIVLTTPVLRALKRQAGAEVHVLTKQAFVGLLQPNPHVDRVWALGEGGLGAVLPGLRGERFDYVVDLHNNLRSWRVRLALGRPASSFPKLNFKKWLLVRFKRDLRPDVHIVERYMAAAAALNGPQSYRRHRRQRGR